MAKLIEVKSDITVPIGDKEKVISMRDFLVEMIEVYKPIGTSVKMLRLANKIIDKIEKPGDTIRLEDAEFDTLKASMHLDDTAGDFTPMVARHLMPFFEAVENAQDIKA